MLVQQNTDSNVNTSWNKVTFYAFSLEEHSLYTKRIKTICVPGNGGKIDCTIYHNEYIMDHL